VHVEAPFSFAYLGINLVDGELLGGIVMAATPFVRWAEEDS